MNDRFVVLSGCSGGGKSTLLSELCARGFGVADEPGRRIVAEELATGGSALPWIDMKEFARRAIEVALADREEARAGSGLVFFDRSVVDAASALEHAGGEHVLQTLGRTHRYNPTVFFTPPWPEIYSFDPERRHGFDEATAEYIRLARDYAALNYGVVTLPKIDVRERADFVLSTLKGATS